MSQEHDYRVEVRESAAKEMRALPYEVRQRLIEAIEHLTKNPRPKGYIKLKGTRSLYRIRVGVYRIVYEINDASRLIVITRARHRREVYE